ncbi:PD-(D/E)XK nuclease family protein [Pectobacterium aroidearum]|uniref:PDDEXK-like family protein n=1 Tax=Pectobacterium aroidearum TaxID=1201031 RepID=UPI00211522ED|nr:PD-(D/E)XK nuclease family protein [Pectobacterium aroidearum]UUE37889.1 PD-(D/E)XK nuclease family protein [Pectobacterium aroidearum]UUE42264.1 PD-(D/E)XK nuclease family protein [Pectobacterium aroidearum]
MDAQEFYDFLTDEQLLELREKLRTSDNILDVINLTENQNSSMLAWCLNPNEGHCQGDAVIKDFLSAAYFAGYETNKAANKKFFEEWPPGRIQTTSFGSAFMTCEFSISDKVGSKRRLDLFLIDPKNRFIVTIENKVGAKLSGDQLDDYYEAVQRNFANKTVFKGYKFAHVVLDKKLDTYSEEKLAGLGDKWALLSYQWLERAAQRARLQLQNNNAAAQLLMAYCQKQAQWQDPNEKHMSELSAQLAAKHESVIDRLSQLKKLKPVDWKPVHLEGLEGEALLFVQQNDQLCNHLIQVKGISGILVTLRKAFPQLTDDHLEIGRNWLNITMPSILALRRPDNSYWPFYVNIIWESEPKLSFTILLVYYEGSISKELCDVPKLRELLISHYPDLEKKRRRHWKIAVRKEGIPTQNIAKEVGKLILDVGKLLEKAREKKIILN